MRKSDFIFNSVQLMYYKCHKVTFRRTFWFCIDSPNWKKETKTTSMNSKNTGDQCFQYAITVVSYEEIKWNPKRVSNIKRFINKYNWKRINYPPKIDDWKTFAKNNPIIALNILYIKEK